MVVIRLTFLFISIDDKAIISVGGVEQPRDASSG
jgi:hypothetical protein